MHIHIEPKHRAISVHPELWYPFLHKKKKKERERQRRKREKSKCTCKHCPSGGILEGKELELSVQRI